MIKRILSKSFSYLVLFWMMICCSNGVMAMNIENVSIIASTVLNDTIAKLIKKAQTLSEKKEYDRAIDIYNQALKVTAENGLSNDAGTIYKKIAGIYFSQKEYVKSKEFYKKSIAKDSLSKSSADAHFNLALIYRKQKIADSLQLYLYKSLLIYDSQDDSEDKLGTYLKAGMIFRTTGYYDLSIKYLLLAYDGFDKLDNKAKKASVSNSIGATQRLLGNIDIAKQYYKESISLREELGDKMKISFGYNNLGNLYKAEKKYDSAIIFYSKAIRIQDDFERTKNLGKYYYNLGTVHYLQKEFSNAERNYIRAVRIKREEGDTLSLYRTYKELAMVAIEQRQHSKAKQYLDSVKLTLDKTKRSDALLRYYEVQSAYYKSIDDFELALSYKNEYSLLYEDLFKEKQAQKIQELQERFESKQKLQQIKELTEGSNNQKVIISKQGQSIKIRNLLLLISLVFVLLAVAVYFLLQQRHKTKEKGLEIHRLESIFKGQETIKEKISKDLHDIVTTSFDGVRLKILALPNAKKPAEVSQAIVSDIAEINEQIRLISHRLSPLGNKIKDTLLTEIIVDQLTEFQYYRKIFVDIQLPLPKEINEFTLASQTNLYGIILETLNNIEKHSQATEVQIKHRYENDNIQLTISDNGIGFQSKDKNGVGLLNMKQRAELLFGKCGIESNDIGTTVKLTFPITANTK